MSDPQVSVVIPTNRGGPYLAEAVQSLRDQTAAVHEIVLVDDGSPDGLREVAQQLGVRYVRQDAAGVSAARNAGVRFSSGDLVAFLDDDDLWHPRKLERQLDAISARPDVIGSYTGGWHMDTDGNRIGADWSARDTSAADMLAGRGDFPYITTLLVRREAYERAGGFDETLRLSEDNDLVLRLVQVGELVGVDEPLVAYRRHAANATSRGLEGRIASVGVIRRQRATATSRGDERTARLLAENYRNYRRAAARENVGDLIGAVRRREWAYAAATARFGLSTAPLDTARSLASRLAALVRSR